MADVVWVLTYDAKVPADFEATRCKWFLRNSSDEIILEGGLTVSRSGDDLKAMDVYPDEIAGQPTTGQIRC